MAEQFFALLSSIVVGLIFGAIYDCIRILRIFLGIKYTVRFEDKISSVKLPLINNPFCEKKKRKKFSNNLIIFLTDIFFFILITPIAVVFVYYVANGNVRWYIFFGYALGFICYYFTFGKLVIFVSEYITFVIKTVFGYISFFVTRPFVPIKKFLRTKISKIKIKISEKSNKRKEQESSETRTVLFAYGKDKRI